jgi:hypothetical protein
MANNVKFQSGLTATPAKGTIVAADEIAGALHQRMKLIHGGAGVNDGDVSRANPFPVTKDVIDYTLYYYDGSGNLQYKCENAVHGTATSATDWKITRFVWGTYGPTDKQILTGSVDGRGALGWV